VHAPRGFRTATRCRESVLFSNPQRATRAFALIFFKAASQVLHNATGRLTVQNIARCDHEAIDLPGHQPLRTKAVFSMKQFLPRLTVALALASGVLTATLSSAATTATPLYPIGTASSSDPSGYTLPSPSALPGYTQSYATAFNSSTLPAGWQVYTGKPGGDPGAQFAASQVTLSGGLLHLTASQDATQNPTGAGNWVTGGLCHCGSPGQIYGAYFVRERVTGAGPTAVNLLWPDANVWPPEIDFAETGGGTSSVSATTHFSSANNIYQSFLHVDMTKWHTWGVLWSPSQILYTVDGQVWGRDTVTSSVPTIPMHLGIQQQTWCGASPAWACPTPGSNVETQVDWVAEYNPTSTVPAPSTPTTSPVDLDGYFLGVDVDHVVEPDQLSGTKELYA